MHRNRFTLAFLAALAGSAAWLSFGEGLTFAPTHNLPRSITLWAWERNENLSYIDPKKIRVAYFAGKVYIKNECVRFRPRTQTLLVPANTVVTPVYRIETIRVNGAVPQPCSASVVADAIAEDFAKRSQRLEFSKVPITEIQIDFDAVEDERQYYKSILQSLRGKLPLKTKISITALASWLLDDKWLGNGTADEAVAMLFSMGRSKSTVLSLLNGTQLNSGAKLDIAVGISANERSTNKSLKEIEVLQKAHSIYIFNSRPWTEKQCREIIKEAIGK